MKQWLKSAIYNPKHTKLTDENILQLLLPSFAGIIICMVCLAGMTWAWLSASISVPPQTITAAKYEVEVTSVMKDGIEIKPQNGKYELEANTAYTVQLEAKGSAREYGGYCLIQNEDRTAVFYTQTFKPDESIIISLTVKNRGDYTFTGVWGSIPSGSEDKIIQTTKDDALDTPPVTDEFSDKENKTDAPVQPETENDETVYVVQPGDTLSKIAERYHTGEDKLRAYNGMENVTEIQIGQEIKIPPADYEMSESPESSDQQSSPQTKPEITISSEESPSAEYKDIPQDLLSQ